MGLPHQNEVAMAFAKQAVSLGYRAFIAQRGHYGFYTNDEGDRVVSFQVDLGRISLGGNYITTKPKQTGTGWQVYESVVDSSQIHAAIKARPPIWAVRDAHWTYINLEQHLERYQASSKYEEVFDGQAHS